MSPLPSEQRRALLDVARRAIVEAVHHRPLPEVPRAAPELMKPCGAFVSLHLRGRLRGCIGQVEAIEPLVAAVARCAVAAAVEDPRFDPVGPEEVPDLEIEISVLSPHHPIRPEEIEVGTHGLIVTQAWLRGLLLPQVAVEYRWSRERFLEETCRKAGLDGDAWKESDTQIEAFTAEVFSEANLPDKHRAQAS